MERAVGRIDFGTDAAGQRLCCRRITASAAIAASDHSKVQRSAEKGNNSQITSRCRRDMVTIASHAAEAFIKASDRRGIENLLQKSALFECCRPPSWISALI